MHLAKNIKSYLEETGITSAALARKAGLPKQTLVNWLKGKPPGDIDQVRKLASIFGCSIDELCYGEGRPRRNTAEDVNSFFEGDFRISIQKLKKEMK